MSKETRATHPIYNLLPTEIEGFDSLAELALDMRWSWNHATDEVWRKLDPELWAITHNPWVVLQTVSRDNIERVLADPIFRNDVDGLVEASRKATKAPAWFQKNHSDAPLTCAAYFSMEFMLSEALPIYSGGLGNVAGDQLKAARRSGRTSGGRGTAVPARLFSPGDR
jgi:starch phosphorylase